MYVWQFARGGYVATGVVPTPSLWSFCVSAAYLYSTTVLHTLTVEVSLSRAFIWRISLQISRLPSESSSDLGDTHANTQFYFQLTRA